MPKGQKIRSRAKRALRRAQERARMKATGAVEQSGKRLIVPEDIARLSAERPTSR